MEYAGLGEAPPHVYFWVAASTLAGALRRRVWIDQQYFQWFPNLYVILVAPPGIISKSTTADLGMSLLREVRGVRFGPSVVTWQALVQALGASTETFEWAGAQHPMSAMTISSSEFGNLLDPDDKNMVDALVNLWDGKSFDKHTKNNGSDSVINPWLNIIACTTPEWIAGSFPEYMIGGGFTSRCVLVYADKKERYVAYPSQVVSPHLRGMRQALIEDLTWISTKLCGPYQIMPDAMEWGTQWYRQHYEKDAKHLDPSKYGGYVARKQTHIHKLAMILAASVRDELVITKEDLQTALVLVTQLEEAMPKVFDKIGQQRETVHMDRMIRHIQLSGELPMQQLYRMFAAQFPKAGEFEEIMKMIIKSGHATMEQRADGYWIRSAVAYEKQLAQLSKGTPSDEHPTLPH